jgi:peroxiredoxin
VRDHLGELHGATVLPVSFGTPAQVEAHVRHFQWPFPFAVDTDRALYRAFGLGRGSVLRVFGPRALARDLWLRLRGEAMGPARQGDVLQLGGDFVLDARGVVTYASRPPGPDARPSLTTLREALERTARGAPGSGGAAPG